MLETIAITLGIANPKTLGDETTKTAILLSSTQHTPHIGRSREARVMMKIHTIAVRMVRTMTALTK